MTSDHLCADLITSIEETIREESSLRKGRPIYLLGEGYGALLAISVAARNSDLDLVLILVDPGIFVYLTTHILFFFLMNYSWTSSSFFSLCNASCVKIDTILMFLI